MSHGGPTRRESLGRSTLRSRAMEGRTSGGPRATQSLGDQIVIGSRQNHYKVMMRSRRYYNLSVWFRSEPRLIRIVVRSINLLRDKPSLSLEPSSAPWPRRVRRPSRSSRYLRSSTSSAAPRPPTSTLTRRRLWVPRATTRPGPRTSDETLETPPQAEEEERQV